MKEAEGHLNNQRSTLGAKPGPSKLLGADCSGFTEGAALEERTVWWLLLTISPHRVQATHENDPYHLHLLTSTLKLSMISQQNLSAC